MSTAQVQPDPSDPPKYKTWILKVSIHCQGCKKKVQKILTTIPGVSSVDIEIRQQKVIVTGNIDAETLLNKLIKSGKKAELWAENLDQNDKAKPVKSKNKERQNDPPLNRESTPVITVKVKEETKPPEKVDKTHDTANVVNPNRGGEEPVKPVAGSKEVGVAVKVNVSEKGEKIEKESKYEGKLPETGSVSSQFPETGTASTRSPTPIVSRKVEESEISGEKSALRGGGEKGNVCKTKKKKGQSGNTTEDGPQSHSVGATTRRPAHNNGGMSPGTPQANHSPPRHREYHDQPRPQYYMQPPPIYGSSNNMAHPSSSYTTSFYASQPLSSYAYCHSISGMGTGTELPPYPYMHSGSGNEYISHDFESYTSQPLDSFEVFSDENPNGCSIS